MSDEKTSSWFVYIVQCADRSLYTGITTDPDKRLTVHNLGAGARYTRSRLPVELVYTETADSRSAALRREAQIKRMNTAIKRELIAP